MIYQSKGQSKGTVHLLTLAYLQLLVLFDG